MTKRPFFGLRVSIDDDGVRYYQEIALEEEYFASRYAFENRESTPDNDPDSWSPADQD